MINVVRYILNQQWKINGMGSYFFINGIFHANRLVCERPSSLKNCLLAVTIIYLHFTQKHILVHDRIPYYLSFLHIILRHCFRAFLEFRRALGIMLRFSFFSPYSNEIERKVFKNKVIMQNASKCPLLRQSFQKFSQCERYISPVKLTQLFHRCIKCLVVLC